ncbi:MAG: amidohydrolase [Tissierellales bacterium]|nr:amidohydrolase [Tissierellales bacterium]MBN2826642.1 amidohydrolase [Tissierellales bacterium]
MDKQELKQKVLEAIDKNRETIISTGEKIFENPELGYKEFETTKLIKAELEKLGLKVEQNIAITGVRAKANENKEGPTIAVMGELDSVICYDHEKANKETGAAHACGHNIQSAAMLGVAIGLISSDVMKELDGKVNFMGVPAEEYVELEYRSKMKEEGKLSYFGGKQELILKGYLDDVDISMMIHSLNLPEGKKMLLGSKGNGFVGKRVQFIGQEAHAGSAPEQGINALNAAMLAMNNIHANRETFLDGDHIRVHPIITKGGDLVNVVPADVQMETYVRGRTIEGIQDANSKVNRALKAGADAVGAKIKITEIPGYLPLLNNDDMDKVFKENALTLITEDQIEEGGEFGGSTDFGDVLHLMPAIHPFIGGVEGNLHTRNFRISNPETAYILPAKIMALTVVDLLFDGAKKANEIIENFKPAMTKEEYLEFLKKSSILIEN